MIRINCDIGERGMNHPVDLALMDHIDIANLACGGHAGDRDSVRTFLSLAGKKKVEVSAHLSYPDKDNFGRLSMVMPKDDLKEALDEQIALMPDASMVKFHGGLYNDSSADPALAKDLADWLVRHHISVILAPEGSAMAKAARNKGITVLAEAFAERRYQYWPDENRLALMNRAHDLACIHDPDEAIFHATTMVRDGCVHAMVDHGTGTFISKQVAIACDTLCVHSDSSISLPLAQRLAALNQNGWKHDL